MYNDLRMDLILKLSDMNMSGDVIGAVLEQLDSVSTFYNITKATTDIAVRGREELEKNAKLFLACKKIEGCKDETIKNYGLRLKAFINFCTCPLNEIDANTIRRFLLFYRMDHNVSDRTLDSIRGDIAGWFIWMQNEGIITKNPCANVSAVRFKILAKTSLTPSELERLRDTCRDARERALVEALYSTGCRISELLNIKVKDVKWDLPQPECNIIGKGDKPGTVYFSPRSVSALKKYLDTRKHDSEWLFCNDRGGGKMKKENVEKMFRKLRELSGLECKKLTPHTMRHTIATHAARLMPIQAVKELLRHDRIDTTMIYAETSQDDVKAYHARVIV